MDIILVRFGSTFILSRSSSIDLWSLIFCNKSKIRGSFNTLSGKYESVLIKTIKLEKNEKKIIALKEFKDLGNKEIYFRKKKDKDEYFIYERNLAEFNFSTDNIDYLTLIVEFKIKRSGKFYNMRYEEKLKKCIREKKYSKFADFMMMF